MALYNVSKIVDDGNFHKNLENKKQIELEVVEDIPCNCKVDLKGMTPPLTVQVRYRVKGDLRVFGSFKKPEPNAKYNDSVYDNPTKIVVSGSNGIFRTNQYYLSFNSHKGCHLAVTAYFTQGPGASKGEGPIKFERGLMFKKTIAVSDVLAPNVERRDKEEEVGVGNIATVKAQIEKMMDDPAMRNAFTRKVRKLKTKKLQA